MERQEHIERTAEKFGGTEIVQQHAWVHDWLDETARLGVHLFKHRQYRQHEKALQNQFIPFVEAHHPEANIET